MPITAIGNAPFNPMSIIASRSPDEIVRLIPPENSLPIARWSAGVARRRTTGGAMGYAGRVALLKNR